MSDKLTYTLHHLVAAIDEYADGYLQARHGVSYNLFEFLAVLAEVEPEDVTGLATCLGISKAAVSKRLPVLEADGWVTTSTDPHHGRRVMISLTAKSYDLLATAGAELEREFQAIFADPSLDPASNPQAIAPEHLNAALNTLLAAFNKKVKLS